MNATSQPSRNPRPIIWMRFRTYMLLCPEFKRSIHIIQMLIQVEFAPRPFLIVPPVPRQNTRKPRSHLALALESPAAVCDLPIAELVVCAKKSAYIQQSSKHPPSTSTEVVTNWAKAEQGSTRHTVSLPSSMRQCYYLIAAERLEATIRSGAAGADALVQVDLGGSPFSVVSAAFCG
jgi:hypothetical protein